LESRKHHLTRPNHFDLISVDAGDWDEWRRTHVAEPLTPNLRDRQPEGERENEIQG